MGEGALGPRAFWRAFGRALVVLQDRPDLPQEMVISVALDHVFGDRARHLVMWRGPDSARVRCHGCAFAAAARGPECEAHLGVIEAVIGREVGGEARASRRVTRGTCWISVSLQGAFSDMS